MRRDPYHTAKRMPGALTICLGEQIGGKMRGETSNDFRLKSSEEGRFLTKLQIWLKTDSHRFFQRKAPMFSRPEIGRGQPADGCR